MRETGAGKEKEEGRGGDRELCIEGGGRAGEKDQLRHVQVGRN